MGRAPCCDKANVRKGPWSPEEDSALRRFIEKHGTGGNWISLPGKAGLRRCGKSCRLRWLNYLRPDIKHGHFSDEEDQLILSLFAAIGSRWSVIASHLPGRTDNDIKNYWNTKLKKKLLALSPRPNLNHTFAMEGDHGGTLLAFGGEQQPIGYDQKELICGSSSSSNTNAIDSHLLLLPGFAESEDRIAERWWGVGQLDDFFHQMTDLLNGCN